MKKIEAIIRKSKYDEVKEALHELGVDFFSYWDVSGIGNEESGLTYRGIKYSTYDRTGEVGDGKIFISDIEKAYRVRNADTDENALS